MSTIQIISRIDAASLLKIKFTVYQSGYDFSPARLASPSKFMANVDEIPVVHCNVLIWSLSIDALAVHEILFHFVPSL